MIYFYSINGGVIKGLLDYNPIDLSEYMSDKRKKELLQQDRINIIDIIRNKHHILGDFNIDLTTNVNVSFDKNCESHRITSEDYSISYRYQPGTIYQCIIQKCNILLYITDYTSERVYARIVTKLKPGSSCIHGYCIEISGDLYMVHIDDEYNISHKDLDKKFVLLSSYPIDDKLLSIIRHDINFSNIPLNL